MIIEGIHCSINANGELVSTLHTSDDFPLYYNNTDAGRHCIGKKVEAIYVGTYDCSTLKVGQEIDIYYDKAIPNSKGGFFQPIKDIVPVSND